MDGWRKRGIQLNVNHQQKKNEILTFTSTEMDLQQTMLSEKSNTKRDE